MDIRPFNKYIHHNSPLQLTGQQLGCKLKNASNIHNVIASFQALMIAIQYTSLHVYYNNALVLC